MFSLRLLRALELTILVFLLTPSAITNSIASQSSQSSSGQAPTTGNSETSSDNQASPSINPSQPYIPSTQYYYKSNYSPKGSPYSPLTNIVPQAAYYYTYPVQKYLNNLKGQLGQIAAQTPYGANTDYGQYGNYEGYYGPPTSYTLYQDEYDLDIGSIIGAIALGGAKLYKGFKGLKGVGKIAAIIGVPLIGFLLLLPVLLLPLLLLPLLLIGLLFIPIPVIGVDNPFIGNRRISSASTLGVEGLLGQEEVGEEEGFALKGPGSHSRLALAILKSEDCLERILCELDQEKEIDEEALEVHGWINRAIGRSSNKEELKKRVRVLEEDPEKPCKKYFCKKLDSVRKAFNWQKKLSNEIAPEIEPDINSII